MQKDIYLYATGFDNIFKDKTRRFEPCRKAKFLMTFLDFLKL